MSGKKRKGLSGWTFRQELRGMTPDELRQVSERATLLAAQKIMELLQASAQKMTRTEAEAVIRRVAGIAVKNNKRA